MMMVDVIVVVMMVLTSEYINIFLEKLKKNLFPFSL